MILIFLIIFVIWGIVSFLIFMQEAAPEKLTLLFTAMMAACALAAAYGASQGQKERARAARLAGIDNMAGRDFEFWCARYLSQRGFSDVSVTRGSNDYGVDILASKDGETYAVQCKRCSYPVSNKAVQEVYTGMQMYGCSLAAVMTNGYFSDAAVKTAEKVDVQLWDRDWLLDNALRIK